MLRRCWALGAVVVAALVAAPAEARTGTGIVAGTVFADTDRDGTRDRGEAGVRGARVAVQRNVRGRWTTVARRTTPASGAWRVRLAATRVRLVLTVPAAYTPPARRAVRVRAGRTTRVATALRVRATATAPEPPAVVPPAPLAPVPVMHIPEPPPPAPVPPVTAFTGTAWRDSDDDGVRDASEPPARDVLLELWDTARTASIAATTTGADGTWRLEVPDATRNYRIRHVLAADTIYAKAGGDSEVADDGGTAGFTPALSPGQVGVGVAQPPSSPISGTVWRDTDVDGRFDVGESPRQGGTVRLYNDGLTQLLAQTTTDAAGSYVLPARSGGAYRIQMAPDPSYPGFTVQNAVLVPDDLDSDVGNTEADRGLSGTLRPPSGTATVGGGVVARANIGNFVWFDTNGDGIQGSEPGVAGVTVQLWNGARNRLIASTTTSATGNYTLRTDMPGDHRIRVLLPPGRAFTLANQGSVDTQDSDVLTAGSELGFSEAFPMAPNVIATNVWDAGLVPG